MTVITLTGPGQPHPCPYCDHEAPLEGPSNLWMHARDVHPHTPVGEMMGGTTMITRYCPTCSDYRPVGHEDVEHAPSLFDLAAGTADREIVRDLDRGKQLKAEGQARVTANTPESWRVSFDAWVHYLPTGSTFTADDVLEGVGYPPAEVHPNTIGARLTALRKRGLIEAIGFRSSERPDRHAGTVRVWRRLES